MPRAFQVDATATLAFRFRAHRQRALGVLSTLTLGALATSVGAALAGPLVAVLAGASPPELPESLVPFATGAAIETPMWAALFLVAAIARAVAGVYGALGSAALQQEVAADLRRWLFERALAGDAFARHAAPDRAARAAGDVQTLSAAVNLGGIALLRNLTTALGLAAVVAAGRPFLGLAAVGVTGAVGLLVLRRARQAARLWRAYWASAGGLAERTAELVVAAPVARRFGVIPEMRTRFEMDLETHRDAGVAAVRRTAWTAPAVGLVGAAGLVAASLLWTELGGDGTAADDGGASASSIPWSALVALVALLRPLSGLAAAGTAAAAGWGAYTRLRELEGDPAHSADPEAPDGEPPRSNPPVLGEHLEITSIVVHRERPLLEMGSLVVPAGALVALTGPNGAGKSTLVHALVGAIPAEVGPVRLDGKPLPRGELSRLFAWLPQEPTLWSGTVRENLGARGRSPREIADAVDAAGLAPVLASLPEGLGSRLGVGGAPLSAGQKQRVALARALADPAPILALDEPFSALDEATAEDLEARLLALRGRRTMLVVTHRRSLLDRADHRIRLDRGRRAGGSDAIAGGGFDGAGPHPGRGAM
jgi:ABC-type multidrug transport system fused ATPase/permease subunit